MRTEVQATTLTQCLTKGMPARHARQAVESVKGFDVAHDVCGGDARGSSAAPVPPFMPAPIPRPSSRAVARLGARCPSATDLCTNPHAHLMFGQTHNAQALPAVEPGTLSLLKHTLCIKRPAALFYTNLCHPAAKRAQCNKTLPQLTMQKHHTQGLLHPGTPAGRTARP